MSIADKLTQIAEKQQRVYDAGFAAGQAQGGGDSFYDTFWDAYQDYGRKTAYNQYSGGFLGEGWTDENFNPKYPIVPTDAAYIFRATGINDLTRDGIVLDFSQCKLFNYAFAYTGDHLKHLPQIDLSSATDLTSTFRGWRGTDLSLIVSETTKFMGNTFESVQNLVSLTISGTIGVSLNLNSTAVLSNASVQNIIDCLKDLSGATAQTLTLNAAVVANMTQAQKDAISAKNWTLVSSK